MARTINVNNCNAGCIFASRISNFAIFYRLIIAEKIHIKLTNQPLQKTQVR